LLLPIACPKHRSASYEKIDVNRFYSSYRLCSTEASAPERLYTDYINVWGYAGSGADWSVVTPIMVTPIMQKNISLAMVAMAI